VSLRGIAEQTVGILRSGAYAAPSGAQVSIQTALAAAVAGTRHYTPDDVARLVDGRRRSRAASDAPAIEVTGETTVAACRRLAEVDPVALNFASARNPGGGFLSGAKAQEEDISRCSALYDCLLTAPGYYAANRADPSLLYTDHLIYSPRVPFFRDDALDLLERPFAVSIITSPAPNAGEASRRDDARADITATLLRRAAHVLAVAEAHGHRTLVLGAWGCGVFRNDPDEVAGVFAGHLLGADAAFAGAFERVVFAVYDRSAAQTNLGAFRRRFG
jgi:uncharacterized protein (TIGR02452 family)